MTTIILLTAFFLAETTSATENSDGETTPREAWQSGIQEVFKQLDTLDLFALSTSLGGMTLKVPAELQKMPMRMIEGAEDLRNNNIEIYLKELKFKDLKFAYEKEAQWPDNRPLIPTLVSFGVLGVAADAKTKLGMIPVSAEFRNGQLPAHFLPALEKGYDILLLPEERSGDARLDDVQLKVGGPVVSGIANKFFSKKVAQLILQYGVGQTLQMGKKDLITGDAASKLLDIKSDTPQSRAVNTLVDMLKK